MLMLKPRWWYDYWLNAREKGSHRRSIQNAAAAARRGGRDRMWMRVRARARAHERTHQAIGLGLCGDASKTRDSGTRRTERPMKRSLRSLLSSRVSPSAAPPAARDTKQKHSAMQTHANAGGLSSHLIESQSESQCESKWNFKYVV